MELGCALGIGRIIALKTSRGRLPRPSVPASVDAELDILLSELASKGSTFQIVTVETSLLNLMYKGVDSPAAV